MSINGRTPLRVHAGECGMGGKQVRTKEISREEAVRQLVYEQVKACDICRPDTELGILE
ncbi:DUF6233 domain-containing protein [Streptomyces agglomeratus]|uniref:DUF6233 domain-containing protein n=1 Tax=Streptomyces agglomeratus TaxID=285458 RepID=UPI00159EFA3B|nr:DUF6233 domain-containing protein [Streptomyces agglomeratus]